MKSNARETAAKAHILLPALCILLAFCVIGTGRANGAEFHWNTSFNLSQEYDDNIYLRDRNKKSDHITRITQNVTLGIRTEDVDAGVGFSIGYAYYHRHEGSGGLRGDLNLFGARDIPLSDRWFLTLDESFRVTDDPVEFGPVDDIAAATEAYSSRNTRNRYYRNRFRGELAHRFGEEDSVYWGYRNNLLKNREDTRQDSMIHTPYVGVRYWPALRHGLDLSLNYTIARFDDPININDPRDTSDFDGWGTNATYYFRMSPETTWNLNYSFLTRDFDSPVDTDYDVHNAGVGVTHQLTETLSASAGIGWYRRNPDVGRSTSGPSGNAGLSKRFENAMLSLQGSWGFREQFGEADNLGPAEFRLFRATYSFQATERMSVSVGAGYYENDYKDLIARGKDKTWYGNLSLSYRILEHLTAGLSYSHNNRSSGAAFGDYKVNRVMLRLSVPFQGRPRAF